jgi:hypothetical protein
MALYLEDFHPGDVGETPPRQISREEIVEFARQFDPQPFHLDEEAARRSPYGGLIASGWHTAALCMRMVVDHAFGSVHASKSAASPSRERAFTPPSTEVLIRRVDSLFQSWRQVFQWGLQIQARCHPCIAIPAAQRDTAAPV